MADKKLEFRDIPQLRSQIASVRLRAEVAPSGNNLFFTYDPTTLKIILDNNESTLMELRAIVKAVEAFEKILSN